MICRQESLAAGGPELLAAAAAEPGLPTLLECSRAAIQEFSKSKGIDLATALLYDRVLRQPANRELFERICSGNIRRLKDPPLVGIVPGAFYLEHKNTGADGQEIAKHLESIGCRVEIIPVKSFGPLVENGAIILHWLNSHHDKQIALVSLSKGSADIKIALAQPRSPELFRSVSAWISVSGLPQGTPLAAWLRRQKLRRFGVTLLLWIRRHRYSVVEELADEPGCPLATWPALPPHLRIVHIVGFPLRRHLRHRWAPRGYERLEVLGPNDGGGFLLAEVARLPGFIFPVWGADHYLKPAWDTASLLRSVFTEALDVRVNERHASQSAIQPSKPPARISAA
jgi:hypothetical protein